MVSLVTLLALAAAVTADGKHLGKDHLHPMQRRQVQGLGELASPAPAAGVSITSAIAPIISSYVFSTTVMQVPVATVCPDTPASSAMFSILPLSSLASVEGSNATGNATSGTSHIPIQVNATALLPNGSTTIFLSASSTTIRANATSATLPAASNDSDTARIIMDSNGCQTVFSASTTTWCSTTVSPAGILPVPVTDCDQWVTFSSQRLDACSTTASSSPSGAAAADGPVAYFVAHWYDLIQGPIPHHVQVEDCLPKSTGLDCITSSESWDVVSATTTSTGTSVASFSGPAVITSGSYTVRTTLSFESTVTTTTVITTSSIERVALGDAAASTTSQMTVTVLATMPTTKTFSLDSLTREIVTVHQTSTVEITETRTRSVSSVAPVVTSAAA